MVIYTREEKVLIIPEGEGCGCQGGGQPTQRCEREKREAYESGYTAGLHADCGEAIDEAYNSGYTAGLEACSGSTDCSSAITEAYQSGYTEGYNQGQADCPECSGGTCNLQQKVFVVTDPAMENVFPDAGYDGLSQVMLLTSTLWDSAHTSGYNDGYQSGYTAGLNDCSGSSCTLEEGRLDISDFWNGGPTVVYPSTADGFNQFTVEDTNGSYAYKHYMDGYNDGLAQCSGETPCDCSSAVTEAYQSGYTEGYNQGTQACQDLWSGIWCADENWDGQEITLTPADFASTGAGFSSITISDCGYGQSKYDEGYADGQADCSGGTCNLESGQASLGYDWTGFTIVYPSQGYDGLSDVIVADLGYGQRKYDEGNADGLQQGYDSGYDQGYQSGSTDGYTSGYTEGYNAAITANCGTAIEEAYQSGYTAGQAACSAATEEAYESGVTEERGNIYAVKIKVTPTSQNWSWTQFGTPHKLTAADASGNNYVFNINYVIYDGYSWDEDAGQTHIDYEFLGRFETTGGTPVKYLTPAQLTIEVPSQDYNNWGSNIGIEVFFNGEMIPAQYEGETLPPYVFDLENGFKYTATSYSVGYNAVDSRCFQLIINL